MDQLLAAWNRLAGIAASLLALVSQFILPLPIDHLDSPLGKFPAYAGFLLAALLALVQWPIGVLTRRKHLPLWGFLVIFCFAFSVFGWLRYSGSYQACTGSFGGSDILTGRTTKPELIAKGRLPVAMTRSERKFWLQKAAGDPYALFTEGSIATCRGDIELAYSIAVLGACMVIISAAQFAWILSKKDEAGIVH